MAVRNNPPYDLNDPHALVELFPAFDYLREHAPVHPVSMPDGRTYWLVSGYDLVKFVKTDARFCNDRVAAAPDAARREAASIPDAVRPFVVSMIGSDPPTHTRLRRLAQPAFAPRILAAMSGSISGVVDDLLTAVADRETFDVVADFAFPMTTAVVSDFLGFPVEDRSRIAAWTAPLAMAELYVEIDSVEQTCREFAAYLRQLFETKRHQPGTDVISALVSAHDEHDALSESELISTVALLLGGGFEATVGLITHGVEALLRHPDQYELLRTDPGVITTAVEELLRYCAAGASPLRYPRDDITIADVTIPRGAPVLPLFSSANHDPTQFREPGRLDLNRHDNRHLSFGHGIHYCMGAPLIRLQARITLRALVDRFPNMTLATTPQPNPRYEEVFPLGRGIKELLVATNLDRSSR